MRFQKTVSLIFTFALLVMATGNILADEISYTKVNEILTKYCAGCHNADEANGEFALHTFQDLIKGGESGTAITADSSASSRMLQMMRGKLDPTMPPEDEVAPTDDEIQLIADWIDAGAKGPDGKSERPITLNTPKIKTQVATQPVTALALSKDEKLLAVGQFGKIEIRKTNDGAIENSEIVSTINDLPGKVTSLVFLANGKRLIAGTGVAGLFGEAILIDVEQGKISKRFRGHRDIVYSVAVTKNEEWFATSGYDRKSVLWKLDSEKPIQEFIGHNDAVFKNVFGAEGKLLITASADATVKVWQTDNGTRLDTRGEPLKEQYALAISSDGRWIVAGGEDNRIRKWELVSKTANQTNPLVLARFAHESAIEMLEFHSDGHLISVAANGEIKIWNPETLTEKHPFDVGSASVQAMAVGKTRLIVGRSNGNIDVLEWPTKKLSQRAAALAVETEIAEAVGESSSKMTELKTIEESEPNDEFANATSVDLPFQVSGLIHSDGRSDVDSFRFTATAGQQWQIETKAGRDKSPLDTHIAVYDADGNPVPRVLLQAVRDSYFTFRGKNSTQANDFRVHNWEEMKLNQLLYCNAEVVRLYHYPRGPDSGYNIYPNFGKRHAMFDTTPVTHALHEPCYIVEPHPPGTTLPAAGLPNFLLNFENDDDSQQEWGTDSRLTFTAPNDGDYIVRVRDSRDFSGEDFKYTLTVRALNPTFRIRSIIGKNPTLMQNGFKKLGVEIDREDNFDGPVKLEVVDLPVGYKVLGPTTIEANGLRAFFTLHAGPDAKAVTKDDSKIKIVATGRLNGKPMTSTMGLGAIKIETNPKLSVQLKHSKKNVPHFDQAGIPVLEIRPGETITAKVVAIRKGHSARINFGKEEAAVNLPFGVYVDNTGLNGVLIPPKQTERTFFLTAEDWVQPSSRLIFLEAEEAGRPASNPAWLRVLPKRKPKSRTVAIAK